MYVLGSIGFIWLQRDSHNNCVSILAWDYFILQRFKLEKIKIKREKKKSTTYFYAMLSSCLITLLLFVLQADLQAGHPNRPFPHSEVPDLQCPIHQPVRAGLLYPFQELQPVYRLSLL